MAWPDIISPCQQRSSRQQALLMLACMCAVISLARRRRRHVGAHHRLNASALIARDNRKLTRRRVVKCVNGAEANVFFLRRGLLPLRGTAAFPSWLIKRAIIMKCIIINLAFEKEAR